MYRYKKILVPLDGSSRAEAILPHVEGLAACSDSSVILLHVVDPPVALVSPYDVMPNLTVEDLQQQMKQAETYLADVERKLAAQEIKARYVVEYGAIVSTIIEVAVREEVSLVAMASHGRSGLSRVFYGSVAAGVLQQIDRPLLLIRA